MNANFKVIEWQNTFIISYSKAEYYINRYYRILRIL